MTSRPTRGPTSGRSRKKLGAVRVRNAHTLRNARIAAGIDVPGVVKPSNVVAMQKLRAAAYSYEQISTITGWSLGTVYKYCKDIVPRPDIVFRAQ